MTRHSDLDERLARDAQPARLAVELLQESNREVDVEPHAQVGAPSPNANGPPATPMYCACTLERTVSLAPSLSQVDEISGQVS